MTTFRAIPVYKVILQWTRKATGYIGKLFEVTIDPDTQYLYHHDESTAGGNPIRTHINHVDGLDAYEPVISDKNTAFNVDFGTTSGTACEGNDARLSDARPPTAHNHDDRYLTDSEIYTLLGDYSLIGHDHDGVYSPVNHDHSGVYSEDGHTHNLFMWFGIRDGVSVGREFSFGEALDLVAGDNIALSASSEGNATLHTISVTGVAQSEHTHDDRYFTETEMAGFLYTLQPYIRSCTDAEAENGEIFISTSVTNLRLSFKDMAGVVTRTN